MAIPQQIPYNYHPPYEYFLIKNQKKSLVRKESNNMGFLLLLSVIVMQIVAAVPIFISVFTKLFTSDIFSGNHFETTIDQFMNENLIDMYFAQGISSLIGFVITGLVFLKLSKRTLNNTLLFKKLPLKVIMLLTAAGFSLCLVADFVVYLIQQNLSFFHIENNFELNLTGSTWLEHILFIVVVGIVPAIAEEFFFRGVLLTAFRKYGDCFAVFTSAFLFGIMHMNFVQIPFAFIIGLILAYITLATNDLRSAILIHFLNNTFAVSMDILSEAISEKSYNMVNETITFIILLLGIIAFTVIIIKKNEFFILSDSVKSQEKTAADSRSVISGNVDAQTSLTLTEKLGCFFGNPGIIICIVIFALYAVSMLSFF